MRAALDACVLYPTVLREILTDVAGAGLFAPIWSARILEEWRLAAARLGPDGAAVASAEIAGLRDRFPQAEIAAPSDGRAAGLDLPDPDDAHVIDTALAGRATAIVTANLRDFPRGAMAAVGLRALHPDPFLLDLWAHDPEPVMAAIQAAHDRANRLGGGDIAVRDLMKRARLPRLGRAIAR